MTSRSATSSRPRWRAPTALFVICVKTIVGLCHHQRLPGPPLAVASPPRRIMSAASASHACRPVRGLPWDASLGVRTKLHVGQRELLVDALGWLTRAGQPAADYGFPVGAAVRVFAHTHPIGQRTEQSTAPSRLLI